MLCNHSTAYKKIKIYLYGYIMHLEIMTHKKTR